MSIKYDDICQELIPSLFIPILLIPNLFIEKELNSYTRMIFPIFENGKELVGLYYYRFLNKYNNVILGQKDLVIY